jgi:hypothetical protein
MMEKDVLFTLQEEPATEEGTEEIGGGETPSEEGIETPSEPTEETPEEQM